MPCRVSVFAAPAGFTLFDYRTNGTDQSALFVRGNSLAAGDTCALGSTRAVLAVQVRERGQHRSLLLELRLRLGAVTTLARAAESVVTCNFVATGAEMNFARDYAHKSVFIP